MTDTQPPSQTQVSKTEPAIWSGTIIGFILSILSIVFCLGFIAGVPGLILGIVGLSKCNKEPKAYKGKGLAIAAFVVGILGIFPGSILLFVFFTEGSAVLPFIYALF